MALCYAQLHYSGKPVSRGEHIVGVVALALLCCVKTSGFAYAGIIASCICLFRLFASFRGEGPAKRGLRNIAGTVGFALKPGLGALLLAMIVSFSPYVTNLLQHRHIFYPLFQPAAEKTSLNDDFEHQARTIYPERNNRFTRLLFSAMAYPAFVGEYPAELKNPLGAPWPEWQLYKSIGNANGGGLGPLFFLLCLLALGYAVFLRGRPDVWLLITLAAITAIQPHSWQVRFAPFVWLFPIVLFLSTPRRKEYLLSIPLLLFLINLSGITYVFFSNYLRINWELADALAPYRGRYVLLDRSIFQCDGFFDRFDIRQKFANPEATLFRNIPWREFRRERYVGRPVFGSNIAFEEDIPLLPDFPIIFADDRAKPWLKISEGAILYDPEKRGTPLTMYSYSVPRGLWNISGKIKFYVRVMNRPTEDIEFILTAKPRVDEKGNLKKQSVKVYANNRQLEEWFFDQVEGGEKTAVLSRSALEESYNDKMHLLTLMFYLTDPDAPDMKQEFSLLLESMEFRLRKEPDGAANLDEVVYRKM
jgi:hypothetical protein